MTDLPPPRQETPCKVVLIERDDVISLLRALPRILRGWKVLVRIAKDPQRLSKLAHLCKAELISSRHLSDHYDYLAYYQTMARSAEGILDQPFGRNILAAAATTLVGIENANEKLRVTLFTHLCMALEEYAKNISIAAHLKGEPAVYIVASSNDAVALATLTALDTRPGIELGRGLIVARFVWSLVPRLARMIGRLVAAKSRRIIFRIARPENPARRTNSTTASPPSVTPIGKVILLPHQGLGFGDLFSKDYLIRKEPDHPLHPDHVITVEYDAPETADSNALHLTGPYPFTKIARCFGRALLRAGAFPFWLSRLLITARIARVLLTIERWKAFLAGFPDASVLLVGYDVHCPKELILGAQANGIRCIALQERNIMAFAPVYPLILDDYLVVGTAAATALRENRNVIIDQIVEIGPIRAPWLHRRALEPNPTPHGGTICILDAASFPEDARPDTPSMVSWENNRLFLEDALALARHFPNQRFILRGKDLRWTTIPYFSDLLTSIEDCPNFELNRTYDRPRVSYELVDSSILVICRHTSLGDEALAAGIPTVFYERTANGNIWMRSTCRYDDYPVYADRLDQLIEITERIVAGDSLMPFEDFHEMQTRYFNGASTESARDLFDRHIDSMLMLMPTPAPAPANARKMHSKTG